MEKYFLNREIREDFTRIELRQVIKNMKRGKAGGEDQIPNACLAIIENQKGEECLRIYNRCKEEGVFPEIWKLVGLPKEKGGLRPILLLPALGSVPDKLINNRLVYEMKSKRKWNEEQYAIKIAKNAGEFTLVVFLDMENAFNKAEGKIILEEPKRVKMEKDISKLVKDFLTNRKVKGNFGSYGMVKGCPQGSSLGPSLWITLMES